jgi:two-component system, NarL family, sensor histidine kinase UhpB
MGSSPQLPMKLRKPSLLSQVLMINALLVAAIVVGATLVASSHNEFPVEGRGALVLALAVLGTLLANAFLLRRRFEPLERLTATMEEVDLSSHGVRASVERADSMDVVRLTAAFNRMLDRLEAERRASASAVVRAQEQERHRIAQDLHDEVNQALTAIVLRLEASVVDAPPELRRELKETKKLAGQAMDELLHLARELRPTALDDHGLLPALNAQVRDFADRTGIAAEFRRQGTVPYLSDDQQLVIYRVTQQSLSNVAQHAKARKVDVELSFTGRTILRVRDDGSGFTHARAGGLGLSGMRERAYGVGANLSIRSERGAGTVVELTME